jgi:Ring finger domain
MNSIRRNLKNIVYRLNKMAAELRQRRVAREEEKEELNEYREVLNLFTSVYKDAIEERIREIKRIERRIQTILDDDLSEVERNRLLTVEKEKVFGVAETLLDLFNQASRARTSSLNPLDILRTAKSWMRKGMQTGAIYMRDLVNWMAKIVGGFVSLVLLAGYVHASVTERTAVDDVLDFVALVSGTSSATNEAVVAMSFAAGLLAYGATETLLGSVVSLLERLPIPEEEQRRVDETVELLNQGYNALVGMVDRMAGSSECPICMNEFTRANPKAYLPCGHSFHPVCIMYYIQTTANPRCPSGCPGRITVNSLIRNPREVPISKLKYSGSL